MYEPIRKVYAIPWPTYSIKYVLRKSAKTHQKSNG